jgi:hypothetical protein
MAEISKQALIVENNQSFPDNNSGAITPSDLRAFNVDMIQSTVNQTEYTTNSGSWNNTISQLNQFTSSQQPSFTALNSFTASQLIINTGVNGFTQSANASLNSLSAEIDQLQIWSGSVNEIRFNSGVPQYSTRWNFGGFISASFVQNVGGLIADINVLNDPSKVNTSSFNDYTASTAATQSVFSASVATSISQSSNAFNQFSASQNSFNLSATASLVELLNLSSSLSGGYATQGELDASSSVLQTNIDTKLNTSSFNAYTQSFSQSVSTSFGETNSRIDVLSSFTGSYATTGSNIFVGNQEIIGDVSATGSFVLKGNQGVVGVIQASDANYGPTFIAPTVFQGVGSASVAYEQFVNDGNYDCIHIQSNLNAGTDFQDLPSDTFVLNTWLNIPTNTGNNPAPEFKRGLSITGSLTLTGSALGNISPLTISSNTASMDLSLSNFFTIDLVSGSTTHLTATNVKKGQTINLLVSQPINATGSLNYNSIFKFPAGNEYVATPISASKDIITFITFDDTTIYATSINNLL